MELFNDTIKFVLPFIKRDNLFMFFYLYIIKGFENTIFKDSIYYLKRIYT